MPLAGFAVALGMNIVNRKSKMCLDLHAPCIDGSSDADCQRMTPESLTKGTNLQLFECNGKKNQEFELISSGRIRNPLTGLCIDIMAPCKDHFREPCERVSVTELKKEANIQLYTCHKDDTTVLSNSYGNQKWNFESGQMRNWLSNLCLEPKLDANGKMVAEANIHADTCEEALYQKFDFMDAAMVNSPVATQVEEKFLEFPSSGLEAGDHKQPHLLVGVACAALMVTALAAKAARAAWGPSLAGESVALASEEW